MLYGTILDGFLRSSFNSEPGDMTSVLITPFFSYIAAYNATFTEVYVSVELTSDDLRVYIRQIDDNGTDIGYYIVITFIFFKFYLKKTLLSQLFY